MFQRMFVTNKHIQSPLHSEQFDSSWDLYMFAAGIWYCRCSKTVSPSFRWKQSSVIGCHRFVLNVCHFLGVKKFSSHWCFTEVPCGSGWPFDHREVLGAGAGWPGQSRRGRSHATDHRSSKRAAEDGEFFGRKQGGFEAWLIFFSSFFSHLWLKSDNAKFELITLPLKVRSVLQ